MGKDQKTFHPQNRVPPTWGKVDLQNKYSPMLSAPSETESDDFSTYVARNRHNLKPSFEEQLQTVHLQRKVNFLQQKLVEKSKVIPTNGKPEHGTAKKISPKTNIKTNNTNSSTQTKITVDQKKTRQGRRIVNTQIQGKDPPCDEKLNKDRPGKYKKTNFIIAGDSMLNHIEGQRLSNKKRVTKVHAFPGATTEDMFDFVRPLAYRSPDYLIIHAATNDLIDFTAKDIISNFQDIVKTIIEIDPKIKIIFSSVIQRFDNDKLQPKVVGLNKDLQALCKKTEPSFY